MSVYLGMWVTGGGHTFWKSLRAGLVGGKGKLVVGVIYALAVLVVGCGRSKKERYRILEGY